MTGNEDKAAEEDTKRMACAATAASAEEEGETVMKPRERDEGIICKTAAMRYFGDTPPSMDLLRAFCAGWLAKKIEASGSGGVVTPESIISGEDMSL